MVDAALMLCVSIASQDWVAALRSAADTSLSVIVMFVGWSAVPVVSLQIDGVVVIGGDVGKMLVMAVGAARMAVNRVVLLAVEGGGGGMSCVQAVSVASTRFSSVVVMSVGAGGLSAASSSPSVDVVVGVAVVDAR